MADYQCVVIGGGPGGYVAAIRAAQNGLRVACIEKRKTLGGTCLNVGCIPSKALLHASERYEEAKSGHLAKLGLKFDGVSFDWGAMQGEKDKAVKELTGGVAFLFKKNKVDWIEGEASFVDAHTLKVGDRQVTADNIVIATGSEVMSLPGMELDGEVVVSSTEALSLRAVPEHLVVIGGGYIGLEMGSVYRRLGAKVTVVEYAPRIVPLMDVEVATEFSKILSKQGLDIRTATKVLEVRRDGAGAVVVTEPAAGGATQEIACSHVLVAVGRRKNVDNLNLDAIGLTVDPRKGIPVDLHSFRTPVGGVWAIGDVIDGPMLAHKAEDEGLAVADNIAGRVGIVNHAVIPAVVYTQPEVGTVGQTEEELRGAGVPYKVGKFPFLANSRAKTNRETEGFVKVIAHAETDRVLGVHMIGSVAGTMIAQAAQAMEFGASSEDIALTCHAHPTHSEALKEAAMAVTAKPIHF